MNFYLCSLLAFILLVFIYNAEGQAENPRVEAGDLGTIIGLPAWTARNMSKYYTFHGIPYAEPTLGENRFKPSKLKPGPLKEDGSPFLAQNPFIFCPQRDILSTKTEIDLREILGSHMRLHYEEFENPNAPTPFMGTEDCLVLNVNTPKIPDASDPEPDLLPVIFYIHGGSADSIWGSVFTGLRLLENPVVLVTINYRLGALGSLNLGIDDAPGNAAMYDSVVALKWVQNYIKHFGGNPNKVTLYGHSSGAVMATHLLLSPLAKGLFHGVIGASGSAIAVWGTAPHPSIDNHLRVAYHAKCYNYSDPEPINYQGIYECMRDAPWEVLREAVGTQAGESQRAGAFGYDTKVPSIQSDALLATERFLSKSPLEILANQEQSNVPLMMGATRHDGSFVLDSTYRKFIVANGHHNNATFMKNDLVPTLLRNMGLEDKLGALYNALAMTYMGDSKNSGNFEDMMPGLIDIHSVFGMKAGGYTLVEQHSKLQPKSYYYSFDYKGVWTTYDLDNKSDIPGGVAHIDDQLYVFYVVPFITAKDRAVSDRFVKHIVNFATYGDPNDPEGEVTFPPFSEDEHLFLKIDAEDSIGRNCRDAWIDNSLELVNTPTPTSLPTTTSESVPSSTTVDSTEVPISTTTPATSDIPTTTNIPTTTTVPITTETVPPTTTGGGHLNRALQFLIIMSAILCMLFF